MAQIKELVSGERLDQELKMGHGGGDLACIFGYGVQTISAAAAITLVVGKAAAGQTQLKSNVLVITNTLSGADVGNIDLTLPPVADWKGVPLMVLNVTTTASNTVTVQGLGRDDGTFATLALNPLGASSEGGASSGVFISTGTLILEVA
tara:strand:+ start:326 stop:772 length:447 start_codon:yes stop_codon:yes gene_type:complete